MVLTSHCLKKYMRTLASNKKQSITTSSFGKHHTSQNNLNQIFYLHKCIRSGFRGNTMNLIFFLSSQIVMVALDHMVSHCLPFCDRICSFFIGSIWRARFCWLGLCPSLLMKRGSPSTVVMHCGPVMFWASKQINNSQVFKKTGITHVQLVVCLGSR